jgi:UPF0176 protein
MGAHHVGKQARLMSQALRKLTAITAKSKTIVIFINQIRMQIGVMFGNPETTPGGKALKFYNSVRLDIRRIAQIKKGDEIMGGTRLSVKVKSELVAFGDPDVIQVDANGVVGGGKHLRPHQVEMLVQERGDEVVFFDGRNAFEAEIGKFKNAFIPDVTSSRDFIAEIESGKYDHIKDKPVVTYCTGGIRCEIISAVMVKNGFKEVYQIDGGIVKYGDAFGDDGLWEGSLYTFDARMKMEFSDHTKVIGKCEKCESPSNLFRNCKTASCHQLILLCDSCAALDPNLACTHDPSKARDAELIG